MTFPIYTTTARSILSPTTGFIREAGFTHSLTPARNCTYGCLYCYVPTMNIYGGLQPADWERWGQFTTFKSNAAVLLMKELRPHQVIYCSPLVDPYQPAERTQQLMPALLDTVSQAPPHRFVIQTRSPLVLRDMALLQKIPNLRVSFSVTTNREDVRQRYESHCEPIAERLAVIRTLNESGIPTFATLAPLLPCDPEELVDLASAVTPFPLIGDPLHVRAIKRSGATTRPVAVKIAARVGHDSWLDSAFQREIVARMAHRALQKGTEFHTGPAAFALLASD